MNDKKREKDEGKPTRIGKKEEKNASARVQGGANGAGDGRGSSSEMPGARVNEEPLIKIRSPCRSVSLKSEQTGRSVSPASPPARLTGARVPILNADISRHGQSRMGATHSLASRRIYGYREREYDRTDDRSCKAAKAIGERSAMGAPRRRGIGWISGSRAVIRAPNEIARDDASRSRSSYDGNETRIAHAFVLVRRTRCISRHVSRGIAAAVP